jgi:oxygen-dependent protoporphyrinogen oxidase
MPDALKRPVAVLGAGIAGLVAARILRRRGVPVVLYEAGKQVAGLAASFRDAEGFTYDFGAHFVTNRLAKALGVESQCRVVRRYGETVLLDKHTYAYPFGLLRVPRFSRDGLAARLRSWSRTRTSCEPKSAADWFRDTYGEALANEVAIPLIEAWSGAPATELAASVGDKIPGSIARTVLLKFLSRVSRRAIAIGYCRELPESPRVWHVYPEGGVALLCQQIASELNGIMRLESPVQSIIVDHDQVVAVRVNGKQVDVSGVISTAPVHALAKLVEGSTSLSHLARFRYRPMVFVNLKLVGRHLLPDTVLWTPESHLPFFRLTEAPISMPWLAPTGKTMLTVDIGAEVGDEHWRMSDDALGEYCLTHLEPIIPDIRRRYLGCRVLRTPIAYPVFLNAYEQERIKLQQSTGVTGLYSVGRNGEFDHILMEDVYCRTEAKMRHVLADLGA